MTLEAWILTLMLALVPHAAWSDTYARTAHAIATAVEAEPPLFDGEHGREKTAALMVSVAFFEGTLNPRAIGKLGERGMFQAMPGKLAPEAFAPGFLDDADTQARVAIRMLRESLHECRALPLDDRLAFYASGSCEKGHRESENRMQRAIYLVRKHPPP